MSLLKMNNQFDPVEVAAKPDPDVNCHGLRSISKWKPVTVWFLIRFSAFVDWVLARIFMGTAAVLELISFKKIILKLCA